MKFILGVLALSLPLAAGAESVFRIEVGSDYKKYSNEDLQRRVWELERAVFQLQQRVFQLELSKAATPTPAPADSWVCTVKAMGTPYVGTATTKPVAKAKAIEACKSARGDGFFCNNPDCEQ